MFIVYASILADRADPALVADDFDIHSVYAEGLRRVTAKATTDSCRSLIEQEYRRHFLSVANEEPFPFEDVLFTTQCPSITADPYQLPYLMREKPIAANISGSSHI